MDFKHSERSLSTAQKLLSFMKEHINPNEQRYREEVDAGDRWAPVQLIEELKAKAKEEKLWNLFLPDISGLSNVDYAPLAEIMGQVYWCSEVFNCSAPDTGNMELLHMYGSEAQKMEFLGPLLEGNIRSCFSMTEPDIASSDATNIRGLIKRDGDHYLVNGKKWWSTGAGDRRCKFAIFMGKTDPEASVYRQQSMIIVPLDAEGVVIERMLDVFGYDDAPNGHAEISFNDVRVPAENLILGEGKGFEIAQGRLGPGRVHHSMRLIGLAERALESMKERASERSPFGKPLIERGLIRHWIAESRCEIDAARMLVLKTAWMMDTHGNKSARKEIAMIKAIVPQMASNVIDRAIQVHGGAGVCQDTFLPFAYTISRMLRIADGPDEVHFETVAKWELKGQ
ncbi:MAG: acyl-CoA dehydrogenase [Pyrinomonadaceae bacterium]|nr:acyl-CoA dehydrogenase [Pyrinomonadaceae bacterium]